MIYFYIGIAGAIGAILRYIIGICFYTNNPFPFATLSVNLIGSFLLAWLTTQYFKKISWPSHIKTAIGTGFVGSFTTFSTLSVETVELFQNGNSFYGFLYVLISVMGGLLMAKLGFKVEGEKQ